MRKYKHHLPLLALAVSLLVASCMTRPSYILGESDFEDILYDIHKAHFMDINDKNGKESGAEQYALMQSILRKHGVTEATWDSTMVYYTRNANELSDIYNNLMTRLSYEADIMGAGYTEISDTTDIWQGEKHVLLTSNILSSCYQWSIPTDTLLEAGEKLTLKFLGLFLNNNAPRRASVVISLCLSNDSVITRHNVISQTGNYTMEITDMPGLGIKSVTGLFMIHKPIMASYGSSAPQDAKQILSINNIALLHEPPASTTAKENNGESEDATVEEKTDTLPSEPKGPIHREIRKPPLGTRLPLKTTNELPAGSRPRI
ncbi:MAG: DUF4296 domain-containing protein [Prevotella sp.]